jgi:steroid delta-isomerase-like uncharacterized protein
MAASNESSITARLRTVQEHVRHENLHHLDGIMQTFGAHARYDDEPWSDHRVGRNAVQTYYEQLISALPDMTIDVNHEYANDRSVVLEVTVRGTHTGMWRGLPGTGRRLEFPLCAVYTFDELDKIAGEKIYYDRATVLSQIGLFHEPTTVLGQVMTSLTHPLTLGRVLCRHFLRQ